MTIKIVIAVFLIVFLLAIGIGTILSEKGYDGPVSDHYDGKRFQNPSGRSANDISKVFRYIFTRKPDKWPKNLDQSIRKTPLPISQKGSIQYTFVNHSTFLLQVDGLNILTDPIWSKRCSPSQVMGPGRMRPPGVRFEELPSIDLVLLSHNHYDHLDKNTIVKISSKWNPTFLVPIGMSHVMKKFGAKKIIELDWWQETLFENLKISASPANHFTSRGLFDRDRTLWCGYVIETSDEKKIYFAGDSGYSDIFKDIGDMLGPMDLSFIPIGAYLPVWFMGPIHISPAEAVQVHQDVQSKQSVAMHFGTFKLADDGPDRAKKELVESLNSKEVPEDQFMIPQEGASYSL